MKDFERAVYNNKAHSTGFYPRTRFLRLRYSRLPWDHQMHVWIKRQHYHTYNTRTHQRAGPGNLLVTQSGRVVPYCIQEKHIGIRCELYQIKVI